MLNTRPVGASQEALANWDRAKNLTMELLLKGWQKYNPGTQLPTLQEAPYQEWENQGYKFKGQKNAGGQMHGIVREVQLNSKIWEYTYKNDK